MRIIGFTLILWFKCRNNLSQEVLLRHFLLFCIQFWITTNSIGVDFAEKGSNRTVIIVAVSVSLSVFAILVFIAVLLRRMKVKQELEENLESTELYDSMINFCLCLIS